MSPDRLRGQLMLDAVIGAAAWLVVVARGLAQTQSGHRIVENLFLFAPLVIVPLGLRLTARKAASGKHPLAFAALCYLHPLAGVAAAGAVLAEPGPTAGFLAGIWGAYGLLFAAWGALRFLARGRPRLEEVAIDAGLVYTAVGGAWFVLSRLGERPLGFGHDIVALTAVHFHYAGFAAPIVVGLAGRALAANGRTHLLWRIGARAVIACPIVVAIGITTAPVVEVLAALVLAIALTMSMATVAWRVTPRLAPLPAVLVWTSAAALPITMVLACVYALGEFTGARWIGVECMAWIHGLVNVFGFALAGLVAWTVAEPREVDVSA